jgi:hypothetical protein
MTTITLEAIKEKQSKLSEMIEAFEAQAKSPCMIIIPESQIELKDGEHYAGIITGKDGNQSHHLILLPGQAVDINWKDAKDWAKKSGGELPTRREQALLYANLKEQFEERWYWSGEQHASDSGFAWFQGFGIGSQVFSLVLSSYRARAVRRLVIE